MHSRPPSISIVVPSHNQGRFLSRNLESIFSQKYPSLEVILMDGGSTDESVEVIHRFENRLKFWRSRQDVGQAAAINEGMSHASGTLVGWLDAGDFYMEDSLWTVGRAYAAHPDFGLYIGNGFCYNQSEDRYTPFCPRHLVFNRDALLHGLDYIFQPSAFFLHSAWQEVRGLNDALHYVMDWDILLRISEKRPAVLINDFLAASRECEETKPIIETMKRTIEILSMIQMRSGEGPSLGSLHTLLETLIQSADSSDLSEIAPRSYRDMQEVKRHIAERFGNSDGFPENGDSQDKVYIPIPISGQQPPQLPIPLAELPTISIVIPSFNQATFLSQALDSILNQDYPRLEILVIDGGSTDGSVEVLREYSDRLTHWVSEPDRGPAHAINKGFERATGDILGWLSSDDLLAVGALWKVAHVFVEDPRLDMVYANAVYIDENNELFLADHGTHRTGLYYGKMVDPARVNLYWSYIHAVPQPTVYFRRDLLRRCGNLNERYQFIFDFELFGRFSHVARIRKIERTQAFYRISTASKTSSWDRFMIELYQLSRPTWPSLWSKEFRPLLADFISSYMRRQARYGRRDLRFWMVAWLVSLIAVTRLGNPEALAAWYRSRRSRQPSPRRLPSEFRVSEQYLPQVAAAPDKLRYKTIFCSLHYPRFPGRSGGEIRDFYLLKHLASISQVEFLSFYPTSGETRIDPLQETVSRIYPPQNLLSSLTRRMYALYYRLPTQAFHREAGRVFPIAKIAARSLQALLKQEQPDFLFISPQQNPIAMMLNRENIRSRFVLAAYDVEAVRIERMIKSARTGLLGRYEISRARRFEAANLQNYDAIIAVSEIDKRIFQQQYGFPEDRILTIDNSVEANHFAFKPRHPNAIPQVIFTATFSYSPNVMAAWRLIRGIMPIVRRRFPEAVLWLVGQSPPASLYAANDQHTVVTGAVDDVRPYLAYASLSCVPLDAGSGTKYKVLEALSAGVPVVCTPLAAEGLEVVHGEHVLIGQGDQELADAIIRLLEDSSLAEMMAQRGRRLIEKRYTWDANLAKLDRWLETIAELPPHRVENAGRL